MKRTFDVLIPCVVLLSTSACVDGVLFGPPVIDMVTIQPTPATANDALTCVYEGFVGGEDASEMQWILNGEDVTDGTKTVTTTTSTTTTGT